MPDNPKYQHKGWESPGSGLAGHPEAPKVLPAYPRMLYKMGSAPMSVPHPTAHQKAAAEGWHETQKAAQEAANGPAADAADE